MMLPPGSLLIPINKTRAKAWLKTKQDVADNFIWWEPAKQAVGDWRIPMSHNKNSTDECPRPISLLGNFPMQEPANEENENAKLKSFSTDSFLEMNHISKVEFGIQ